MAKRYLPFRSQFSRDLWTDGLAKWLKEKGLTNLYVRDIDGYVTQSAVMDTEDGLFELTQQYQTVAFVEHKTETEATFHAITSSTFDSDSLRYQLRALNYKASAVELGQQLLSDNAPDQVHALFITEQKQENCQELSDKPIYRAGFIQNDSGRLSIKPACEGELFDRESLYNMLLTIKGY